MCELAGGQRLRNRKRPLQRHTNWHEPTLAQGACMRQPNLLNDPSSLSSSLPHRLPIVERKRLCASGGVQRCVVRPLLCGAARRGFWPCLCFHKRLPENSDSCARLETVWHSLQTTLPANSHGGLPTASCSTIREPFRGARQPSRQFEQSLGEEA